ncbi:MAG: hypothetical protein HPY52_10995 [Firmicutes bacterium]|nr:hypothetical protein [Bacillota bacterium]
MWAKIQNAAKWVFGVLAAIGAILLGWNRYQTGRAVQDAGRAKRKADDGREKVAVEAERQQNRKRAVEGIETEKKDLDKRLEDLKKRAAKTLMILLAMSIITTGVVRAEAPQLPSDYAALAKLYFAALDQIVELKAQRDEAIAIAEGYQATYEKLKIQYDSAEASVSQLMETIKTLQGVIDQQHDIILKLAGKKNLGVIGGLIVQPGDTLGTIKPGALVALQVGF